MQKFDKLNNSQLKEGTPEDKIIIIKSVFSKEAKLKIQPTKNTNNGRYNGIEENLSEIEKQKRGYLPEVSSTITIKDGFRFDLNDPQDAADWEWIQHSRHIASDFEAAQKTGLSEAWFYVHRPGAESRKKLDEIQREYDIVSKIMEDTEVNLYNRVRLMGIDMSDQPISDVKEYLLTAAKDRNRRQEVETLYNSSDISLKLMLYHGLDNKIVEFDGFAYKYGQIMLGTTERLALEYLSNPINVAIVKEIENAIYPSKKETALEEITKKDPLAAARAAKAKKK